MAVFAAGFAVFASVFVAPPAQAAGPRPSFQIPFPCSERWGASTRSGHPAIDWNFGTGSDDLGKTVTAAAAGTATQKYHYAYGYYVDVDHGGGWVTRYAHLLSDGRGSGPVAQGEPIGRVGSTGSSTSPHLHWEQRADGVAQSTLTANGRVLRADGRTYTSRNCLRRDPYLSGDIDGDGVDDLVARFVASDGSSSVKIIGGAARNDLRARTTLTLTPAQLPATALLSLGDTNGDGRADLNGAFARDGGVKFVSFYGTRSGEFSYRRTRHLGKGWSFNRLQSVQAADVDGDGIADLTARFLAADGSSTIRIIKGAGTRTLTQRRTKTIDASVLPRTASLAVGDTNNDARADLNAAYATSGAVHLVSFYGNREASFGRRRYRHRGDDWAPRTFKGLRVADVQGDGIGDFVARFVESDGASTLRVVRGRSERALGAVTTTALTSTALPPSAHVTLGDTNGNGRDDLNIAVASNGGTQFASFYGKDTGSFGGRINRFAMSAWEFHRLC